jgi:hypothetical protein
MLLTIFEVVVTVMLLLAPMGYRPKLIPVEIRANP